MNDETIEQIDGEDTPIAYVIRARARPERTSFATHEDANLQAGFVVYPAGGEVVRHVHLPLERSIVGTAEVLLVREGSCEVDVYDERRELVATRTLECGDIVVFLAGGHGVRMLEDTVLFEVKQGPYTGLAEKEQF